ncbi:penicillin-binding transpeptidase domain-containing protein [Glutamicibacter uratoxydans]|uniref:penicillin-binding transpeptidase domain-containing protein n=1 Tax=Glutamicibacter uratoxydans TaxID=43667 RepID=UPI003D6F3451
MNQAIRRVWIALVILFVVCFGALSYIQFFAADQLSGNSLNKRQLYREFDLPRGAILVDGKPIAESVPTEDGQFTYQRVYHEPEVYAHLTGFYSLANMSTHLESELNSWLTGNSSDLFLDRLTAMFTGNTSEGAAVELTIDDRLQQAAFEMLPDDLRGHIVVTEVKTGNILVMASKPSFDPNDLSVHSTKLATENLKALTSVKGLSPYVNPAIGNRFTPGSSFKILDLVAGLESGEYDLDTPLVNPDSVNVGGANISNFIEGRCSSRTEADLRWITANSCNTPFALMSEKLGNAPFEDVVERFGYNQQLSIPLPVVNSHFPLNMSSAELAQSAIGGFENQATPLQMNMVAMGIANDGVIMQPNLIKKVIAPDLRVIEEPAPKEFSTATTKEIADQVAELMKGPVESGTAVRAQVPGVDLRAKTGTANLPSEEGEGRIVNSWITGFAPGDDPEVAITVALERIDYNTHSRVAVDLMKQMTEAVFNQ